MCAAMIRARTPQSTAVTAAAAAAIAVAACGVLLSLAILQSQLACPQPVWPLPQILPQSQSRSLILKRIAPPVAERRPISTVLHNVTLIDDYAWLRSAKTDQLAAQHLANENAFTTQFMRAAAPLRAALVAELAGAPLSPARRASACLPADQDPDTFWEADTHLYWTAHDSNNPNRSRPLYLRRTIDSASGCLCDGGSSNSTHTNNVLVLDLNDAIPSNASYYYIGFFEVNPHDNNLLAYSVDLTGDEKYTVHFWDIRKRREVRSPAYGSYYSARWIQSTRSDTGATTHWLYYNTVDNHTGVPNAIMRVCIIQCTSETKNLAPIGPDPSPSPELVYTETDLTMTTELASSTDGTLVLIRAVGQITSETHILTIQHDTWSLHCVIPRSTGIMYDIDHHNGSLYIRTNADGFYNYRVVSLPLASVLDNPRCSATTNIPTNTSVFNMVVPHSETRFIEKIETFATHTVVWFWESGLRQVGISDLRTSNQTLNILRFHNDTDATTQVYSLLPGTVLDIEARLHRRYNVSYLLFSKSSFLDPNAVYCARFDDLRVMHVYQAAYATFDRNAYRQKRVWAPSLENVSENSGSRNGTAARAVNVPLSIVYHINASNTKNAGGVAAASSNTDVPHKPLPALVMAYGAYGGFYETEFSADIFALLNRGVLFAVCHPRGDGDMGAQWYTAGKYAAKRNTFQDTRSCVRALVDLGYAARDAVAIHGRSAGGLVAGNAVSWMSDGLDPVARVVVAHVPFIDPVFDMIDATVPWTAVERYEWGDPANKTIFDAMRVYSPYMNIANGSQPAVLITTGMNDPRVPFWEPAKYVARLRSLKTNDAVDGLSQCASTDHNTREEVGDRHQKQPRQYRCTPLFLRVYNQGHFSSQDESSRLEDLAEWYAFVLYNLDVSGLDGR